MGCFSWVKIDDRKELAMGQPFKLLVPKEFGGGHILSEYEDYGNFEISRCQVDLHEVIAFWNRPKEVKMNKAMRNSNMFETYGFAGSTSEHNDHNRVIGIHLGVYDQVAAKLKYPLKIVSPECNDAYEDFDGRFSIMAPDQGWNTTTEYDEARFEVATYTNLQEDDYGRITMPRFQDEHHEEDDEDEEGYY